MKESLPLIACKTSENPKSGDWGQTAYICHAAGSDTQKQEGLVVEEEEEILGFNQAMC